MARSPYSGDKPVVSKSSTTTVSANIRSIGHQYFKHYHPLPREVMLFHASPRRQNYVLQCRKTMPCHPDQQSGSYSLIETHTSRATTVLL